MDNNDYLFFALIFLFLIIPFAQTMEGFKIEPIDNAGLPSHQTSASLTKDSENPDSASSYVDLTNFNKRQKFNYFVGAKKIAEKDDEGNVRFIHEDNLGSTVLMTDLTGNEITNSRIAYDAFGLSDTYENRFTGKQKDQSTGLIYFGSRYYDPNVGRFISADSLRGNPASPQTLNRYSYVSNNPEKYVDLSGNQGINRNVKSFTIGLNNVQFPTNTNYVAEKIMNEVINYYYRKGFDFRGAEHLVVKIYGSDSLDAVTSGAHGTTDESGFTESSFALHLKYRKPGDTAWSEELFGFKSQSQSRAYMGTLRKYFEIDSLGFTMHASITLSNDIFQNLKPISSHSSDDEVLLYYLAYLVGYHEFHHAQDTYSVFGEIDENELEAMAYSAEAKFVKDFLIPKIKEDKKSDKITAGQADLAEINAKNWEKTAKAKAEQYNRR